MEDDYQEELRHYLMDCERIAGEQRGYRLKLTPKTLWVGSASQKWPSHQVEIRYEGERPTFDWSFGGQLPDEERRQLEAILSIQMDEREAWLNRVECLISSVEKWAKELDIPTRRVEKKLKDYDLGDHTVSALILQDDLNRLLLEPRGSASNGTRGIAEMYLMPAYDDFVLFLHEGGDWVVYDARKRGADLGAGRPFSKEVFAEVLRELKQDVATT